MEMIKIRLMGEREEIKIIIENISHINDVRILSLSDFYANRGGASDYGRIYMEVEKKDAVMLYGKEGYRNERQNVKRSTICG